MVKFVEIAEIRSALHDETKHYEARTLNGNAMPARDWRKRFVMAEVKDSPCVLRFADGVKELDVLPAFVKGMRCEVVFVRVEIDSDVTQIHVSEIKELKK
jgi:hypothetical protein